MLSHAVGCGARSAGKVQVVRQGTNKAGLETMTVQLAPGVEMAFIRVPPGEFLMGSPPEEPGRMPSEGPPHRVRIERGFYLGRCEVTQQQWQAVMGENPSWYSGDPLQPVERIHWVECRRFCRTLSDKLDRTVRLPTEAEWEYACRAGTTTPYFFGAAAAAAEQYAWFRDNAGAKPQAVGQLAPNPWGFHDILGNVWEWCEDPWHETYDGAPADGRAWESGDALNHLRVLRGGAWRVPRDWLRSAFRYRRTAGMRAAYIGLRLVIEEETGSENTTPGPE